MGIYSTRILVIVFGWVGSGNRGKEKLLGTPVAL